jgi:hypothetical protein
VWSAGWPSRQWALRQEIALDRPLDRPHLLIVALARTPPSSADVRVWLNGAELGAMRAAPYDRLELLVPADRLASQRRLTFELRLPSPDAALRVLAHRWSAGATLGGTASAYFDGTAWRSGTYDDTAGLARAGVYTMELEPR